MVWFGLAKARPLSLAPIDDAMSKAAILVEWKFVALVDGALWMGGWDKGGRIVGRWMDR